jgi:uncharacterized protein (DUF488 family)
VANPVFTIGHSNRTLDEFVDLLRESGVEQVVDIRSIPRSRANPQFNRETLADELSRRQVAYAHCADLGGLRGRQHEVDPALNAYWRLASFHNYADYALGEPFAEALTALRAQAARRRCVIMCAEVLWWRCHRRIVADHLLAAGEAVQHILGPAHLEPAQLTPAAAVGPNGAVTYPQARPQPA